MATQRPSFAKMQRERDKKAKQAAKRERRFDRTAPEKEGDEEALKALEGEGELSAAQLIALIEETHRQLEAKEIDFEEFEERKAQLLARLPID